MSGPVRALHGGLAMFRHSAPAATQGHTGALVGQWSCSEEQRP